MSGDNIILKGTFAASQLYVVKTTDEDNNDSYEFTDELGRVLLQLRIRQYGQNEEHLVLSKQRPSKTDDLLQL